MSHPDRGIEPALRKIGQTGGHRETEPYLRVALEKGRYQQCIDLIDQPGLLWGLDSETEYSGLLRNKRAVLALTSGAFDPEIPQPAFGIDHQSTHLKFWLNQTVVTDIEEIRFPPPLLTPDPDAALRSVVAAAKALTA